MDHPACNELLKCCLAHAVYLHRIAADKERKTLYLFGAAGTVRTYESLRAVIVHNRGHTSTCGTA